MHSGLIKEWKYCLQDMIFRVAKKRLLISLSIFIYLKGRLATG